MINLQRLQEIIELYEGDSCGECEIIVFRSLYEEKYERKLKYTGKYFSTMPRKIFHSNLRFLAEEYLIRYNYIINDIKNTLQTSGFVGLSLYFNYNCDCKMTTYDHTLTIVRCEDGKDYIVDSYIYYRMAGIRRYKEEQLNRLIMEPSIKNWNRFCESNHKYKHRKSCKWKLEVKIENPSNV